MGKKPKNFQLQPMKEDEITILSSFIFNFIKDEPLLSGDIPYLHFTMLYNPVHPISGLLCVYVCVFAF